MTKSGHGTSPPTPRIDPYVVTHESLDAAVSPVRRDWESRHLEAWPTKATGESAFCLMLAELTGRSSRRIRAALAGADTISLRVANEILVALDMPHLFHALDVRPRYAV